MSINFLLINRFVRSKLSNIFLTALLVHIPCRNLAADGIESTYEKQ